MTQFDLKSTTQFNTFAQSHTQKYRIKITLTNITAIHSHILPLGPPILLICNSAPFHFSIHFQSITYPHLQTPYPQGEEIGYVVTSKVPKWHVILQLPSTSLTHL